MPAKGGEIEKAEVVIVGGGVIGLACAWRARQRGLDVRVLDRGAPGAASAVAAGMLSPATEAEFGEERLLELSLRAAETWPAFPPFAGMTRIRFGGSRLQPPLSPSRGTPRRTPQP